MYVHRWFSRVGLGDFLLPRASLFVGLCVRLFVLLVWLLVWLFVCLVVCLFVCLCVCFFFRHLQTQRQV